MSGHAVGRNRVIFQGNQKEMQSGLGLWPSISARSSLTDEHGACVV